MALALTLLGGVFTVVLMVGIHVSHPAYWGVVADDHRRVEETRKQLRFLVAWQVIHRSVIRWKHGRVNKGMRRLLLREHWWVPERVRAITIAEVEVVVREVVLAGRRGRGRRLVGKRGTVGGCGRRRFTCRTVTHAPALATRPVRVVIIFAYMVRRGSSSARRGAHREKFGGLEGLKIVRVVRAGEVGHAGAVIGISAEHAVRGVLVAQRAH